MKGQFPWIGRSRGSAGGMTTAKINDKNVMRAKAYDVTNPKTAAQVMQRDFFKEVQEVCASVTEDQLRSLFGVKPKTMTRRNALSKQIAAAYTITEGVKNVDFSKLLAIGNGEKVTTQIAHFTPESDNFEYEFTNVELGVPSETNLNLVYVFFCVDKNAIVIKNYPNTASTEVFDVDLEEDVAELGEIYVYATCGTNPSKDYLQTFGSFIIKTRATD